ncbi:hypothetical protein GQ457_09G014140 [Hibiscus cannabinus]
MSKVVAIVPCCTFLGGDFNADRHKGERSGCREVTIGTMKFNHFIETCSSVNHFDYTARDWLAVLKLKFKRSTKEE